MVSVSAMVTHSWMMLSTSVKIVGRLSPIVSHAHLTLIERLSVWPVPQDITPKKVFVRNAIHNNTAVHDVLLMELAQNARPLFTSIREFAQVVEMDARFVQVPPNAISA